MRVPYAQFLGKVPFKAVVIVLGAGAAAAAGFAALSWTANASRPVATSEPVVRSARVMEIAYQRRSQSLVLAGTVVPRIETTLGFRVAGKIITRSIDVGAVVQTRPPDRPARSRPTIAWPSTMPAPLSRPPKPTTRAPRPTSSAISTCAAPPCFTPQTLEQRQSLAATAQARVEQARSQLSSAENNLAYTELRCRCRRRRHRRAGRGRPGAWRRARAWCAWRAPTSSRSWSACPSTG